MGTRAPHRTRGWFGRVVKKRTCVWELGHRTEQEDGLGGSSRSARVYGWVVKKLTCVWVGHQEAHVCMGDVPPL